MIRPLRQRHRWMIAIIAAVVLLLFFAALASRPERPIQDRFDVGAPHGADASSSASWETGRQKLWPARRVLTRSISSTGGSEHGATAPRTGSPAP